MATKKKIVSVKRSVPSQPPAQESKKSSSFPIVAGIILAFLIVGIFLRVYYAPAAPVSPATTPVSVASSPVVERKLEPLDHTFTFQEVFTRLQEIDKSQNTDFRKESLSKRLLPLDRAEAALDQVRVLRDDLNRSIQNNETVFWINLVEARYNQLESEKNFNLALAYGRRGLYSRKNVEDSCSRQKEILEAAFLYNQSARLGGRAMAHYDAALTQEVTWPVLGVNDNKMAIFNGDTRDIGALVYNTVEAIRTTCLGLPPGDLPSVEKSGKAVAIASLNQSGKLQNV